MKSLFTLLLLAFVCISLTAQINLTTEEWQSDLRFLQKTVHEDYPFLFKKVTAKEFDAEVEKLRQAIPDLQEHEIIVGLARIVALFKYGHTSLYMPTWHESDRFRFTRMPFNLYHFSDGLYVQGVHKNYEQALGARVLKVEGKPVEEALAAVRPVGSEENEQFFKAYGPGMLGVPEILHAQGATKELKKTVTLSLEKDGKTFDVTFEKVDTKHFPGGYGMIKEQGDWLDARDNSTDPLYLKNLDRIYFYEYLPQEKVVYVRHSQIQDDPEEPIPAFYERLFQFIEDNEVEKLILDVRLNGGGNNYKNKPIVTGIIRSEKINQPGKLFVIIGRRTFSACQNLVNELDNYTEAIFVGEPTSENVNFYGDNRPVTLPNSQIPVYLSFAWWQDKPQWENEPWLAPHLAVEMSFEDYQTNRDPVLKAALNFSQDNFVLDPIAHLTKLYEAGKVAELKAEATRFVNDPSYRFFNFEDQFNRIGYRLMENGQLEPALFVFQMNTDLFPKSANARDSLGEAFWKAGQKEKAVEYYNKAIKLDPEGSVGQHARMMLKKIAEED
jgi:tetratricopeptide (TPR) repeat protein